MDTRKQSLRGELIDEVDQLIADLNDDHVPPDVRMVRARLQAFVIRAMLRGQTESRAPMISSYPCPPWELAGKWVAWSRCRIVASADTLDEVIGLVERNSIPGASFERLPKLT